MKRYTVEITPSAESELVNAFEYIKAKSPLNAERWLQAVYKSISKLESITGYGRAMEAELLGVDLRQLVFKSHRILFTVDDKQHVVTVHYIRHGAMKRLGEPD
jgi:plasmid stabilization system protein ParE